MIPSSQLIPFHDRNDRNFWIQVVALTLLGLTGLMASFLAGYLLAVLESKEWEPGNARRIRRSFIPADMLEDSESWDMAVAENPTTIVPSNLENPWYEHNLQRK